MPEKANKKVMIFDQLLENCESVIETHLLHALYLELAPDVQKDLRSQHIIDYYDLPATLPDFAFPDAKIAIYCDGYDHHSDSDPFQKDRQQSRDLQLQDWCVLRSAGAEILNNTEAAVETVQKTIRWKARERSDQEKRLLIRREKRPVWGFFAAGMVATVVLMILLEYFAPTLFFHLTGGL